jgi:hypothetical protein
VPAAPGTQRNNFVASGLMSRPQAGTRAIQPHAQALGEKFFRCDRRGPSIFCTHRRRFTRPNNEETEESMKPTHVFYSRSAVHPDEWQLDQFQKSEPIFAWVTIDPTRNSVRFHTKDKICLHDEGAYEWRPVTPDILKIAENAKRKTDDEFARLDAACGEDGWWPVTTSAGDRVRLLPRRDINY